jgi:GNAT superfamily N-acetyltransferase
MAALENVTIRTANASDLGQLDTHAPISGLLTCEHESLIGADDITLWVGVTEDSICGHVNLHWTGFRTNDFAEKFPDTPVLNGLAVWPENLRKQGIGKALVRIAEASATSKGFDRIGLDVYADNHTAVRFDERLGYKDWGCGVIADRKGRADPGVTAMIKRLK